MKKHTSPPLKTGFVVLLHGILRSRTDMLPLSRYLKKRGYETINILYPSRKKNIEDLTAFVDEKIRTAKNYSDSMPLHFVTHSMGGLIARYYIASRKPKNLGRVVMLAPPNGGSEFADFLTDHKRLSPIFEKLFGPASGQLVTGYKHLDGAIDYPLGIIAGNRSINPLAPWILPGEHDGIVPVERTKIDGMRDHIVVPSTHTFMMFRPAVMRQVAHFLEEEKFKR
ncbi:MAG: alpha/beta hydrolase [Alphaproteobacteria bacterium]